jgi:hypothetical protein
MNIKDFYELTGKVRAAQKRYFLGGRLQGDLIVSKQLESKLDKALSEGIPEPTATVQVYMTEQPAEYVTTAASAEEKRQLQLQLQLHLEDGHDAGERDQT